MQGPIAQTLGLAMHANAFLRDGAIADFWPDSSFFHFCRRVRFLVGGAEVAADPAAWLTRLGRCGFGVRMHEVGGRSDVSDVAFAGGASRWLIAEASERGLLGWQPIWSHVPEETDSDRPWLVTYQVAPIKVEEPGQGCAELDRAELDRAERELESSLDAIAGFADRIRSDYAPVFRRALECLGGKRIPLASGYPDLAPVGLLDPRPKRLLAASQAAWVFGGMGSWNDDDRGEEGNGLTETLLERLERALAAVVNSTAPPAPGAVSCLSPTAPAGR